MGQAWYQALEKEADIVVLSANTINVLRKVEARGWEAQTEPTKNQLKASVL